MNRLLSINKIALLATVLFLSSCSLNKMIELAKKQKLTVTPNPLELHGDSVKFKMTADLPIEMLKKGTTYTVKTIYKYGNEQYELEDINFDSDDYVGKTKGAKLEKNFSFLYEEAMKSGTLNIIGVASKKGTDKVKETPEMQVATGIITTPRLAKSAYKIAYADAGRTNKEELEPLNVPFYFLQGSAVLRPTEIKGNNGIVLDQFIASKFATKRVSITGSHSPEGTESINSKLSEDRAKAIESFYFTRMKQYDYKNLADSIQFVTKAKFQDWNTMLSAVASDSELTQEQKNQISSVVNGSGNFEEKEQALKTLDSYSYLFKKIYPTLRSSETEIMKIRDKKSDAEIALLAKQIIDGQAAASSLQEDELLYAAQQTPILEEKEKLYKAQSKASNSWKSHNNLAATYLQMAEKAISKEQKTAFLNLADTHSGLALKETSNGIILNNAGVVALLKGDKSKARSLFTKAKSSASGETLENVKLGLGSLQILDGNYSSAVSNLNGVSSSSSKEGFYNAALANILSRNYDTAKSKISKYIETYPKEKGEGLYLMSIVHARMKNHKDISSTLNEAIRINAKFKDMSIKDEEFRDYVEKE
ncbi:MAG: hypothetical protein AB8B61_09270 [Cyclobacteriaceae bacterium]